MRFQNNIGFASEFFIKLLGLFGLSYYDIKGISVGAIYRPPMHSIIYYAWSCYYCWLSELHLHDGI